MRLAAVEANTEKCGLRASYLARSRSSSPTSSTGGAFGDRRENGIADGTRADDEDARVHASVTCEL